MVYSLGMIMPLIVAKMFRLHASDLGILLMAQTFAEGSAIVLPASAVSPEKLRSFLQRSSWGYCRV
jgi:hypothetical protein